MLRLARITLISLLIPIAVCEVSLGQRKDANSQQELDDMEFEIIPAPAWKELSPADGSFSIRFPSGPTAKEEVVRGKLRRKLELKGDGVYYSFTYSSLSTSEAKEAQTRIGRSDSTGLGGSLLSQRKFTINGYPAFEAVIQVPMPVPGKGWVNGYARTLSVASDTHFYILSVGSPTAATLRTPNVESFFKFFRLKPMAAISTEDRHDLGEGFIGYSMTDEDGSTFYAVEFPPQYFTSDPMQVGRGMQKATRLAYGCGFMDKCSSPSYFLNHKKYHKVLAYDVPAKGKTVVIFRLTRPDDLAIGIKIKVLDTKRLKASTTRNVIP